MDQSVTRTDVDQSESFSGIPGRWIRYWAWARSTKSAGMILDENNGIGPGYDFVRLFLSVTIVIDHCYQNFLDRVAPEFIVQPALYTILGIFFALSGFLVTGSALRTMSLPIFISFRILRIVPALMVETFLSALVIGPLVTTLPLQDYFTRTSFFTYFGNIVGHVQTTLPGVFTTPGEVDGTININLWTLKPELSCYLIMTLILFTSSLTKSRVLILSSVLTIVILTLSFFHLYDPINGHLRWHLLVYAFVLGSLFYLYRYSIRINIGACIASFVAAVLILQADDHRFAPLAVPLLVYVTVCLGMWRLPLFGPLKRGDYSYGIYLYGFPISVMLFFLVPAVKNIWLMPPAALLLTFIFAAASWNLIEKPALGLRKRLFGRNKVVVHP